MGLAWGIQYVETAFSRASVLFGETFPCCSTAK